MILPEFNYQEFNNSVSVYVPGKERLMLCLQIVACSRNTELLQASTILAGFKGKRVVLYTGHPYPLN